MSLSPGDSRITAVAPKWSLFTHQRHPPLWLTPSWCIKWRVTNQSVLHLKGRLLQTGVWSDPFSLEEIRRQEDVS